MEKYFILFQSHIVLSFRIILPAKFIFTIHLKPYIYNTNKPYEHLFIFDCRFKKKIKQTFKRKHNLYRYNMPAGSFYKLE